MENEKTGTDVKVQKTAIENFLFFIGCFYYANFDILLPVFDTSPTSLQKKYIIALHQIWQMPLKVI